MVLQHNQDELHFLTMTPHAHTCLLTPHTLSHSPDMQLLLLLHIHYCYSSVHLSRCLVTSFLPICTSITSYSCISTQYWYSQYIAMLFLLVVIRCVLQYSSCHYFIFNYLLVKDSYVGISVSTPVVYEACDKYNLRRGLINCQVWKLALGK